MSAYADMRDLDLFATGFLRWFNLFAQILKTETLKTEFWASFYEMEKIQYYKGLNNVFSTFIIIQRKVEKSHLYFLIFFKNQVESDS